MDLYRSFLLILTGLSGIYGITTVSKVSVKVGNSISIPCLYDSQYRNHVKYLCKGYTWNSCSYAVKTNQANSEKFLISDDKTRRTFTVTIKDLTYEDAHYWCAVEINRGLDVKKYFHLIITTDMPSLYVMNQRIKAPKGGDITINCSSHNSGEMKWCRLGRSCVTSSGSIDGANVSISTKTSIFFTVTMSGLKMESSGWYLCVKGDLQMPVHLTVFEQTTTSQATTTVQGELESSRVDLMSLIIPLTLLIFIVMAALLIWFILKRRKQTKAGPSATARAKEGATYRTKKKRKTSKQAEQEVTYSDVNHVGKTSGETPSVEIRTDLDVTYSSVVTVGRQTAQRVEPRAEDVTYSTLAQH